MRKVQVQGPSLRVADLSCRFFTVGGPVTFRALSHATETYFADASRRSPDCCLVGLATAIPLRGLPMAIRRRPQILSRFERQVLELLDQCETTFQSRGGFRPSGGHIQ